MFNKTNELTPDGVSSLKDMISSEKARLRQLLADTKQTAPPEGMEPGAKIHSVFSACFGN